MTTREWEYCDATFMRPYIYDNVAHRVIATLEFVGDAVERTDSPDRDFPETDANGRVMAAAWELLDACEEMIKVTNRADRTAAGKYFARVALGHVRIAIAKARGPEVSS